MGERGQNRGGEREREVESEKRDYGRGTRTHEHRGKSTHETKLFIKIQLSFVSYKLLFYRDKRAVTGRRRIAAVRDVIEA